MSPGNRTGNAAGSSRSRERRTSSFLLQSPPNMFRAPRPGSCWVFPLRQSRMCPRRPCTRCPPPKPRIRVGTAKSPCSGDTEASSRTDGSSLASPVRRPFHDPIAKPKDLQRLANHPSRLDKDNAPQSFGRNAVPGCDESGDATAIHESEARQIDDDGRAGHIHQHVGQEISGHDVQLAAQFDDMNVEIGKVADGNSELGQHGVAIPPKVAGGRLPGDRSALSMLPQLDHCRFRTRDPPQFAGSGVRLRAARCTLEAKPRSLNAGPKKEPE